MTRRRPCFLLALGVAGVIVASGCGGSGGSISGLGGGSGSTPAGSTPAGSTPAGSAPAGSTPAGVRPAWGSALGSGVTVLAPTKHPASGSPGGVALSYIGAIVRGDFSGACRFMEPAAEAACKRLVPRSARPSGGYSNNLAVGYVAVEGDEALVGWTGSVCNDNDNPPCSTNADPAAILDNGQSFDALYSQAVNTENDNSSDPSYFLAPMVHEKGTWYWYFSPSYIQSG